MAKLTITIDLDEAAFKGSYRSLELARILHGLAHKAEWGDDLDGPVIRDAHGNKVGGCSLDHTTITKGT